MSIITVATDYGSQDGYSGVIKGIFRTLSPDSEIIAITDHLTTIMKTSLVLLRYYSFFPPGTVHLVVNDPTVGSERRALIGTDGKYMFVGPDNGVFTQVITSSDESAWFSIDMSKLSGDVRSSTFHGRDIFAPAAAMLAGGIRIDSLGELITDPVLLLPPVPVKDGKTIHGEVMDIDKFGDLITNIAENLLTVDPAIRISGKEILYKKTFADVAVGTPVAYIGSLGFLEIAINQGRADRQLNAAMGAKIEVLL